MGRTCSGHPRLFDGLCRGMTNADAADIAQHDPTHAEITLVLLRQKRAKLGLMASDVRIMLPLMGKNANGHCAF
jgi:hypothetical protein